jgi:release factor glutamine methyltransferase
MLTLREVLKRSEDYLGQRGADSPRLSAQLMAAHGLGLSRLDLFLQLDRILTEDDLAAVRELVARRATGEPAAYILGEREFFGLPFQVNPAVLIPRPETEHLVEAVLERADPSAPLRFADLGTGSGALAVTLASRLPRSLGLAVDVSLPALDVARTNASAHDVDERLALVRADMAALPAADGSLDLAVSNPPYVREQDWESLDREVREFEPRRALVSGPTGLEALEAAAGSMARALKPGGLAVLEIGFDQGGEVLGLLEDAGFAEPVVLQDLSGYDRIGLGVCR